MLSDIIWEKLDVGTNEFKPIKFPELKIGDIFRQDSTGSWAVMVATSLPYVHPLNQDVLIIDCENINI